MSIASLGIVGGLAGTALPQRAAESERVQRETVDQSRAAAASEQAESAAGIGQTEEDSQTSDRDADGRRLWEQTAQSKASDAAGKESPNPLAKDPSGTCGGQLDLVG
jgi:type II secretory pathway pseudopilin PulG